MQAITYLRIYQKELIMNKYKIIVLTLFLIMGYGRLAKAQSAEQSSKQQDSTQLYQSAYNIRPVLLHKGQMLASLQLRFPRFYKTYNPKEKAYGKISDKIVLSEAYFSGYFTYGISNKINIYAMLPMVNIHHYTPMRFQTGIGFGDIEIGGNYQLLGLENSSKNALSVEMAFRLPTGKYKNLAADAYPTGLGSFGLTPRINGLHHFNKFDLWYSAYYEYRTDNGNKHNGDQTGLFVSLQKSYHTTLGEFGLEGGLESYYNFTDKQNGKALANTEDYAANLYVGGWYKYLDKFYLRFGVPYSIYQNSTWLTKYQVMIQFDYLIN